MSAFWGNADIFDRPDVKIVRLPVLLGTEHVLFYFLPRC
jgi:hypothetical protein